MAYTEFCLIFASNLAPTITQQQKRALFCRGNDPCHLDETTGGELQYSPEHPLRFLRMTRICPPYGKHSQKLQGHRAGGSRPVALCLRFDTFLLFPAAQNMRLLQAAHAVALLVLVVVPFPSSFPAGVVGVCGRSGCPWKRWDAARCSGRCYSCGAAGTWLTAGYWAAANLPVVPCGQGSTRRIRGRSAPPRKTSIVRLPYPLEYPLP